MRKEFGGFRCPCICNCTLHSTFIRQLDGVSCHPACLWALHCALHCALSRGVVKGILQVPQDRFWLLHEMAEAILHFSCCKLASTLRTLALHWEVAWMYTEPKSVDPVDTCFSCDGAPHIAYHECKVLHCTLHASILCHRCSVLDCANSGRPTLLLLLLFLPLLLFLLLTPVPVCRAVASGMGCLHNTDGQLRNDQAFCTELQGELKRAVFGMCTNTPIVRGKLRHADTKANLIFKSFVTTCK